MTEKPNVGLIGLGTMGRNLALNIAENGFKIAVNNRTTKTTHEFITQETTLAHNLVGSESLEDFVAAMEAPRKIILMVPAGPIVDDYIAQLLPLLDKEDIIIDAGNANFGDSNRRAAEATKYGYRFLGIGVSGGEEGARFGPSIMGGGPKDAWDEVAPVLKAISAKHEGQACATWMGQGGAGHFVKMVHNGIEYADMQMIAEVYGIMRNGLGMSSIEIGEVFSKWNKGPLQSYLVEITANIAGTVDEKSNKPILDIILDKAGQKGTGRWTAIEAQNLATPVTVIEAAVAARNISATLENRIAGEELFGAAPKPVEGTPTMIDDLEAALLAGKITCYAQGFDMLAAASATYEWGLPMPDVAEVWREGCIIRSTMLNDMAKALSNTPDTNLMFSSFFAEQMKQTHNQLRSVVSQGISSGCPIPALSAGLIYFDMMRTSRSTANMIQAQRDYFGAHTFKRLDEDGDFNGPWNLANN